MKSKKIRFLKICLLTSILPSFVGSLMMLIAWNHNSQGEIFNENGVDLGYLILIGVSWFIPTWIILFPLWLFWFFHKARLQKIKP
jgi:H+/gluconate symporter-like permease